MQIVIDIPNRIYNIVQTNRLNLIDGEIVENAIKNGTPLTENHGDLIDVNELKEFSLHNDIASSCLDGSLIYNAGDTSRGDIIWKPVIDELTVVVKAAERSEK